MSSPETISKRERILGGLWGSLVGDALGVPVEFQDRARLKADPVTDMREFGVHHQPAGTWSDDGALTLCTIDSLLRFELNTQDIGERFVRWMNEDLWTATGIVFDIGGATTYALNRIAMGTPAELAGGIDEYSNGNGSLMRILPVALRFANEPEEKLLAGRVERASAITHGHARSKMACVLQSFVVRQLLLGWKPESAIQSARTAFSGLYQNAEESTCFKHLLEDDLAAMSEDEIVSSGYVLHTLHASFWSLITSSSFEKCILKAVNLGGDTDTTGCVAGGLAGVCYGVKAIPEKWIRALPRHNEVDMLFNRFAELM